MKIQYLLFVLLFVLCGCSDKNDTLKPIKLNQEETAIKFDGNKGILRVNTNFAWKAESDASWVKIITKDGDASKALHYEVEGNLSTSERVAKITIKSEYDTAVYTIKQAGKPEGVDLKYRIPIIFHVLYQQEDDPHQNPPYEKIIEKLNMANAVMDNGGNLDGNSTSLGVQFVLATHDPQGNVLREPGVERIQWHERKVDANSFMYDRNPQNIALLWDPNQYVNVMLYNFTEDLVAGIATFPVLPEEYAYKHLAIAKIKYVPGEKLKDVRCVSINSLYIVENDPMVEVGKTLAHELGHYLGLRHTFSEEFGEKKTELINCHDTDGCEDTPSYNRQEYSQYLDYVRARRSRDAKFKAEFNLETLYSRINCFGEQFIARNVMDYDYCKKNLFTKDQKSIVRTVLEHGLLIPGPKYKKDEAMRSVNMDMDFDIPYSASRCPEMVIFDK